MNKLFTDNLVKGILALIWSLFVMWAIGYIIITFGKEKEILTLIIGIISGTILGGIFGVYFASALMHKNQPNAPGTGTMDMSITANIPDPEIKKEQEMGN